MSRKRGSRFCAKDGLDFTNRYNRLRVKVVLFDVFGFNSISAALRSRFTSTRRFLTEVKHDDAPSRFLCACFAVAFGVVQAACHD